MRIKTIGNLSRTEDEIGAAFAKNRLDDLLHFEGEYLIVIENENQTVIVPSYYGIRFRWRAPFIDRAWVESVMNLPHRFRFKSHWHRFAIAQNEPGLLDFPFEKDIPNRVHYARYPGWFSDQRAADFIYSNAHLLEDLLGVKLLRSIVEEHAKLRSRTRTLSFLITQIFWRMTVNTLTCSRAQGRALEAATMMSGPQRGGCLRCES